MVLPRWLSAGVDIPITIKCIGIDDTEDYEFLESFVTKVAPAGCRTFIIHARKAWPEGLEPRKENAKSRRLNMMSLHGSKLPVPIFASSSTGGQNHSSGQRSPNFFMARHDLTRGDTNPVVGGNWKRGPGLPARPAPSCHGPAPWRVYSAEVAERDGTRSHSCYPPYAEIARRTALAVHGSAAHPLPPKMQQAYLKKAWLRLILIGIWNEPPENMYKFPFLLLFRHS